jgi:hypothetical protein
MSRTALLLLHLFLAAPVFAAQPAAPADNAACPTLWAAYMAQTDGLAAAASMAQAHPRDPVLIARVQAARTDLHRAIAGLLIAGCI